MKTTIKTPNGRILGFIETRANGDKIGYDSKMMMLGKYNKATDVTQTYQGVIAYRGDALSALIINNGRIV